MDENGTSIFSTLENVTKQQRNMLFVSNNSFNIHTVDTVLIFSKELLVVCIIQ